MQRLQKVRIYFQNNGSGCVLRPIFGQHNRPVDTVMRATMDRALRLLYTQPQRCCTLRTEGIIAAVEQSVEVEPNEAFGERRLASKIVRYNTDGSEFSTQNWVSLLKFLKASRGGHMPKSILKHNYF